MADNNEEEYLDALLKSMLNSDDGSTDEDTPSPSVDGEFDSSEDDDMALLTRMLMSDNDIPFDEADSEIDFSAEDSNPIEHSDMESFLSLDDLLNATTNDESGDIVMPEDDPEITPILSEGPIAFADPFTLEEEDALPVEEPSMDIPVEEPSVDIPMEEEASIEDDFFGDFDEIGAMFSNENTSVNEEALRKAMLESDEPMVHDTDLEKELADILALDEGMSINDIPDEEPQDKLSEDELLRVRGIEAGEAAATEEEEAPKKGLKALFGKKSKKEKADKEKKEKAPKAKKEKKDKPKKEKTSLKDFFAKFEDEEDEPKSADNNQKLIDELYKDKDSLDDMELEDEGKGKKGKKAKKEKKKKPPKVKKEKAPKEVVVQEKIHIGKIGVAIITLLIIVFLFGGFFGVRFINYQLTINSAKKYYEMGNYDLAYERVSGLDIMDKDMTFYNRLRTVMIVYQGYDSYNNYIEMDQEAKALDALINAVGRKQQAENAIFLYEIEEEVDAVYEQILDILEFYEIDEQMALDLYTMTNYEEYYETLLEYEGVVQ